MKGIIYLLSDTHTALSLWSGAGVNTGFSVQFSGAFFAAVCRRAKLSDLEKA